MWLAALGAFDAGNPGFAWLVAAYLAVAVSMAAWLHFASQKRLGGWLSVAPAIAIALATLLRMAFTSGIDADESEHLHLAFTILRDVMPYRELDQNHSPLLWLLSAPLLALLPESPYVLLVFRALCLASFAGSIAIACAISRSLLRGGAFQAPFCTLLGLVFATQAEVYRFRPDTFMNTLALGSLYLLIKPAAADAARSSHSRVALIAGLLQGLAVAFSPKLAHLVLIAPLVLWLREPEQPSAGAGARLASVVSTMLRYGSGLALGFAPVVLWLAYSGLLTGAYESIILRNLGSASRRVASPAPQQPGLYNTVLEAGRLLEMAPFFAVALAGAAMAALQKVELPGVASRAVRYSAVLAWLLWMALWTFTPNAATYHIAGALLLGGSLGALALDAAATRWKGAPGRWGIALLIALLLGTAPLRAGIGGYAAGYSYSLSQVAWLLDEVRSRGDACLCIVPWHPIFVANVAPVYRSNQVRRGNWSEAVAWTIAGRPAAVMAPRFAGLVKRGVLQESERARMSEFLNTHYELVSAGSVGFWLLKEN